MAREIRNIVIGVAEIEREDPHLAAAVKLADSLDATLHVVHAFTFPDPLLYPYAEMTVFAPEHVKERDQAIQELLEKQVRKISSSDRILYRTLFVPGALAILNVAEEVGADLIVLGASRRGPLAGAILGTTAQRVLRATKVPVLVVRRPDRGAPRRVLFTTDLSELSEKVYERGVELVTVLGNVEDMELHSLLVVNHTVRLPPPQPELAEMAESELTAFLSRHSSSVLSVKGKVREGDPAREIIGEATEWDADLLVLGTQGRSGASRFLIGSVAEAVLRRAPCDALVLPTASVSAPE